MEAVAQLVRAGQLLNYPEDALAGQQVNFCILLYGPRGIRSPGMPENYPGSIKAYFVHWNARVVGSNPTCLPEQVKKGLLRLVSTVRIRLWSLLLTCSNQGQLRLTPGIIPPF